MAISSFHLSTTNTEQNRFNYSVDQSAEGERGRARVLLAIQTLFLRPLLVFVVLVVVQMWSSSTVLDLFTRLIAKSHIELYGDDNDDDDDEEEDVVEEEEEDHYHQRSIT